MTMGLNFGNSPDRQQDVINVTANEIEEVKQYDIVADRQQLNAELVNSAEVDAIVSTIEVNNLETTRRFTLRTRRSFTIYLYSTAVRKPEKFC